MIIALPCPFCGHNPVIKEKFLNDPSFEYVAVGCLNTRCHVRPHVASTHAVGKAEESAIRRWNTRNIK